MEDTTQIPRYLTTESLLVWLGVMVTLAIAGLSMCGCEMPVPCLDGSTADGGVTALVCDGDFPLCEDGSLAECSDGPAECAGDVAFCPDGDVPSC